MQINGSSPLSHGQPIRQPAKSQPAAQTQSASSFDAVDELELSKEAQALSQQAIDATNSPARNERVAQIKAQIADGSYETPEKLDAALDKFLDSLG